MINGISSGSNLTAAQKLASLVPARDPEQAKKDKETQAALQQTLQAMKNSKNDLGKQRKSMAASRVAQIKAQIKALKQAVAMDPKATARMIARLVKQLAQALKDYASAGATYTEVSSSSAGTSAGSAKVVAAPEEAADTGGDDDAIAAPPADAMAGDAMPEEALPEEETTIFATGSKAYEQAQNRDTKAKDDTDDDNGSVKTTRKKDDDSQFIKDAKELMDELRNFLKLQKARMAGQKDKKDYPGQVDDIDRAEKAMKDAERQFQAMTRAVSAPINVVS